MSLNRRRRIFRPEPGSLPSIGGSLPAPGVVLAALGGAATLAAVFWLFVRPSNAPARAPTSQKVSAAADQLAVIDGDTLRVGDRVLRLEGIAAPARGSVCHSGSLEQDCGVASANALASLLRTGPVDCTIHGHDTAGRATADCRSAGQQVGAAMVREGWARAEGDQWQALEAAARAAARGMWITAAED